jgi:hypothetical protein
MMPPPICPCDGFEHPATILNAPGLASVHYRAGDFRSFRRALLLPLSGEKALANWRPMPRGDLALQMLEWWAYVADVLTFYGERSINASLLGTATLDGDVRGLVRILGYRPRPGIGGSAVVGALLSGSGAITLAPGFRLQSKPAPGKTPQTFETTAPFAIALPDAVPAAPLGHLAGPADQLYLAGTISVIQPGDLLVLAPQADLSSTVLVTVQAIHHLTDSSGSAYTEIVPSGAPALPAADAAGYRLLRSTRSAGLWKYATTTNRVASPFEMEGVDRSVAAGQIVVMTAPGSSLGTPLLHVTGTTEQIWYTNGDGASPPASPTPPAGAPHTRVSWTSSDSINATTWNNTFATVKLLLDWRPAGTLRNAPSAVFTGTPAVLVAAKGRAFRAGSQQTVLIEDADGAGVVATASVAQSTPSQMSIDSFAVTPPPSLKTPLRVLHNVVQLTRGKTVDVEQLGIGDATVANQEFVLRKSPLTYLPAGDSYKSTLALFVNGARWTEVASFYEQPPDAQVFVTFEDDEQKTHAKGGDGVNGAAFPTGAPIVARYRIESGLDAPAPGALTTIAKPFPGLRAVHYPVAGGGGADPDPRDQIRRYAPRSVLTFGRAIAADDYEAIAAGAPSVTRVRAVYAWNAAEQRATVSLFVGDTAAAVASAKSALLVAADPNRPVSVAQAIAVHAALFIGIRIRPGVIAEDVVAAVRGALADPDRGLFGERRTGIGETIYFSQMSDACAGVPGVDAVSGALFWLERPDPQTGSWLGLPPRVNVSAGEYLVIPPEWVLIFPEVLTSV